MLRLLLVVPHLQHLGDQRQLVTTINHLPTAEYRLHVCLLGDSSALAPQLERPSVRLWPMRHDSTWDLACWRECYRKWRMIQPDIIQIFNGPSHYWLWLLSLMTCPRVLVSHPSGTRPNDALSRLTFDYLASRTEAILTNWQARPALLRQEVVCPGVEPALKEPAQRSLRQMLGLPEDAKLIGVIGQLEAEEGLPDAIWAADLLKNVRDDTHLLIWGDGRQRWRLSRFVTQTETSDRVHFVEGHDAWEFLDQLSYLWLPNRKPTNHYFGILAMSVGVPVIASDLPSHREFIQDRNNGLLFGTGNRAALARHTQRLLEDSKLRDNLVRQARDTVERYTVQRAICALTTIYEPKANSYSRRNVSWFRLLLAGRNR